MFGLLIGKMSALVEHGRLADRELKMRMEQSSEFLRVKAVPLELRRRIRVFFELFYARNSVFEDDAFVSGLSPALRKDMITHLYSDIIHEMVLFDKLTELTVMQLCAALKTVIYEHETMIMREDDVLAIIEG